MTKTPFLFALAATVVLAATPALADRVDHRQTNQHKRIENGVRSGQLTPQEAAKLKGGQREIATLEKVLKSDGRLTPAERAYLAKKQNDESRRIFAEKHDRDGRGYPWWKRRYFGYGYGKGYGYGYDHPRPRWW